MRTDRLVIVLFVAAICAPTVDLVVRPGVSRAAVVYERRRPADFPALEPTVEAIQGFPPRFETWFRDSCGLRDKLLRWRNRLLAQVLGVSPTEGLVLGKDGWVFVDDSRTIDILRGIDPFPDAELRAWRRALQSRQDWCESRGIEHLFVVAPNKTSIYPERFPDRFDRVGRTRLDQLLLYLRENSSVEILDLRPALLEAKEKDRDGDDAYFPLGSHWTDRGAFAGYRAIVDRLRARTPELEAVPEEGLAWGPGKGPGDSWAGRLHMQGLLAQRFKEIVDLGPEGRSTAESARARAPRLVMFHDSFGLPLHRLLEASFSHCTFRWKGSFDFDTALIDSERADVVIVLLVERVLGQRDTPRPLDLIEPGQLGLRFDASQEVLLSIDGRSKPPAATRWGGTVLESVEDGLEVRTSSARGMVQLPPFTPPTRGVPVMRIDMTSAEAAPLLILYTTSAESEYVRQNSYSLQLAPGRNILHLEMFDHAMNGRMLLRPGSGGGRFVLHALEIRTVAAN